MGDLISLQHLQPKGRYASSLNRYRQSLSKNTSAFKGFFHWFSVVKQASRLRTENGVLHRQLREAMWANYQLGNECRFLTSIIQNNSLNTDKKS